MDPQEHQPTLGRVENEETAEQETSNKWDDPVYSDKKQMQPQMMEGTMLAHQHRGGGAKEQAFPGKREKGWGGAQVLATRALKERKRQRNMAIIKIILFLTQAHLRKLGLSHLFESLQ